MTLTLNLLSDLKVFDHAEALQEVSGQASSEASLEAILKKVHWTSISSCVLASVLSVHQIYIKFFCMQVEDSWKTTEFTVLSHRDSKDVFILGGTDDIQVLLDDSQVNVSTIAGSRHVGPIKPKVDEWSKQLTLFSETLVSFIFETYMLRW